MSYSRINPRQSIFFKSACEFGERSIANLDAYAQCEKQEYYDEKCFGISAIVNNNASYAIIFLCLGLEAFLYDYGARYLGDNYVKKYLDKLDVVSKIVIYPKLITGKEIDRDKKYFGDIKKMIAVRNELVHSKSHKYESSKLYTKDVVDIIDRIGIVTCFKSTIELIKDIYSLSEDDDAKHVMSLELRDLEKIVTGI